MTSGTKWARYPTPQELLLLRALQREGPMRGVEIRGCVRGKIVQGHVYVLVQRLRRKKALVRHRVIDNPDGGGRVPVWKITPAGRVAIRAMDLLEAA